MWKVCVESACKVTLTLLIAAPAIEFIASNPKEDRRDQVRRVCVAMSHTGTPGFLDDCPF
jgi:hypothetical protein